MQPRDEVITAFHSYVNMSASELDAWLASPESRKAGTGVGHDSGERISDMLRRNPRRVPEKYEEEDVDHMRKVVAYCKRHLAQEDKLKETKTPDELEHTKSTISLKNWGHDPMKTLGEGEADEKDETEHVEPTASTATKRKHDEVVADEDDTAQVADEDSAESSSEGEDSEDRGNEDGDSEQDEGELEGELEEPERKRTKGPNGEVQSTSK